MWQIHKQWDYGYITLRSQNTSWGKRLNIRLQIKVVLMENFVSVVISSTSAKHYTNGDPVKACTITDCFHTRAKCVIWILIPNAHFELKFERLYFGPSYVLRIPQSGWPLGRHRRFCSHFPPSLSVLSLSYCLFQPHTRPFTYVVLPSFLLSSSCSFPWYSALQYSFGESWWSCDVTVKFQFSFLHCCQEVFIRPDYSMDAVDHLWPCVRQITSQCVIWNAQFKWRSGGVFQLRISQITQLNHCMNAPTSKLWFGGRS